MGSFISFKHRFRAGGNTFRRTSHYGINLREKSVSTGTLGALDDPLMVQTKI